MVWCVCVWFGVCVVCVGVCVRFVWCVCLVCVASGRVGLHAGCLRACAHCVCACVGARTYVGVWVMYVWCVCVCAASGRVDLCAARVRACAHVCAYSCVSARTYVGLYVCVGVRARTLALSHPYPFRFLLSLDCFFSSHKSVSLCVRTGGVLLSKEPTVHLVPCSDLKTLDCQIYTSSLAERIG